MSGHGLTGPGDPFELEEVNRPGGMMRNFVRGERSLRELVVRAARRGDREFLVEGSRRVTFAEFGSLVWGTARSLLGDFGLQAGERVAIIAPNSIDWIVTVFGVVAAGGVAVALNPSWTADELRFALDDSGARLVVGEPDVATDAVAFSTLVRPASDPPDVDIDEDDPFVILYTSGTTGRPKGCVTTHRGTIAQVRSVILTGLMEREATSDPGGQTGRRTRQPVLLASSPLFHVSGLHSAICLALATGTKTVLTTGRFDPAAVVRLIEQERVTAWGAVPTMIQRVVDCPEAETADLSTLESVAIGGAPLPPAVLERARAVFGVKPKLGNGYGLTETHGPVTMNAGASLLRRPGSVGRPGPVVDLRITDPDGHVVPTGTVGEVCLHGPTVTPGYWNRPAENAELFRDGWFRTGDLGYVDAEGFLFLVDRLKDMIIRGGENIYCVEVEDALAAAPGVDEVAVFGVPDDDLGERVAAVVTLQSGDATDAGELRAFLVPRLARYKIPDQIEVTTEPLPRNATGKVLKGELRSRLVGAVTG